MNFLTSWAVPMFIKYFTRYSEFIYIWWRLFSWIISLRVCSFCKDEYGCWRKMKWAHTVILWIHRDDVSVSISVTVKTERILNYLNVDSIYNRDLWPRSDAFARNRLPPNSLNWGNTAQSSSQLMKDILNWVVRIPGQLNEF